MVPHVGGNVAFFVARNGLRRLDQVSQSVEEFGLRVELGSMEEELRKASTEVHRIAWSIDGLTGAEELSLVPRIQHRRHAERVRLRYRCRVLHLSRRQILGVAHHFQT